MYQIFRGLIHFYVFIKHTSLHRFLYVHTTVLKCIECALVLLMKNAKNNHYSHMERNVSEK